MSVGQEAVSAYRGLAAAGPDRYRPGLAGALSNLSGALGEVGRHAEALVAANESVIAYKKLARTDPGGHGAALASALTNFSVACVGVGRPSDAIRPTRESIAIYRWLAADDPGRYDTALENSLDNLATCLDHEAAILALRGRTAKARKLRAQAATIRTGIGAG